MNMGFLHMLLSMMIQLERPTIRRRDMSAVLQTLADEHIGIGKNTDSFADALSQYLSYPARLFTLRSILDALSLALRSLNLERGSLIGVSALAPSWYRQVIARYGLEPVMVDIDPDTLCMDEQKLSGQALGALIVDEMYGYQAPKSLYEAVEVPVIANISQSFGSTRDGLASGSAADIVIMSFEQSDIVSCGGGAAVAFADESLCNGIEKEVREVYQHIALGDMNSALGLIQLGQMQENLLRRESFHQRFFLASQRNRHRSYAMMDEGYVHNGYSFILTLEGKYEESEAFAKKHGILTSRAFRDILLDEAGDAFISYPRSAAVASRTMRFPLYPFLTEKEVQQIERVIAHIP